MTLRQSDSVGPFVPPLTVRLVTLLLIPYCRASFFGAEGVSRCYEAKT